MTRYLYGEWDGSEFPTPDRLGLPEGLLDLVLAYGDRALEALESAELDEEHRRWLDELIRDGLLERAGVRWRLTPKAVAGMQRRALMEVFANLRRSGQEGHESAAPGPRGERSDGTRPYGFGDPVSEIDAAASLRNAVGRQGPGLPIRLDERDFEIHQSDSPTDCSTVILLDLSGSMYRDRRYIQAKLCAMAMHAFVRQRFPRDTIDVAGFYTTASIIPESKLPLVLPKRIGLFDPHVRLRVPLREAESAPQHFTNLHMGLRLARQILRRRGGENRQVFIITDGEPTAHLEGEFVHLLYPPDPATTAATLREAVTLSREGLRICTFALIDDYGYMDWVGFVDRLTQLTRGVAFYCHGGDLGSCIMESYLSGKRRKAYLA